MASLTTSGIIVNTEAAPGEQVSNDLTVSLSPDEPAPQNIEVDLLEWNQSLNGANHGVKDNPEIAPYSATKFLSVSPKNFTIKPGTSQDVNIHGVMPKGDGGRYAIVAVRGVANSTKKGNAIAVSFGINAQVLLTISDSKIVKTGEIENISITKPITSQIQNFTAIFKNTGNYHYGIDANASLKDEKGEVLAKTSQQVKGGGIIPTASRMIRFSMKPSAKLKPGNYTVEVEATLADGTVLANKEIGFEIKT